MARIDLAVPASVCVETLAEGLAAVEEIGYPTILRPSFTMGGGGGGIAYNREEYESLLRRGLDESPTSQVLIEESVLGWKEYELEVMCDSADNVVVICSIENIDPMGVHTGDSITVAPAQTLTDKEFQVLRDAAVAIMREIGVDTGGSNVQFAVDPQNGKLVVIEMNPRVSRSSALASKATGFPIAKIAALLSVGYTLDELTNDITQVTPASFEPTIDYVVTKVPRFSFEKFPGARPDLTTQMKSVGESMAMGRTFRESLGKALRSLEIGRSGLSPLVGADVSDDELRRMLRRARPDRLWLAADAFRRGLSVNEIAGLTAIDPWFLAHIEAIVQAEAEVVAQASGSGLDGITDWRRFKGEGLSDQRIGELVGVSEDEVRAARHAAGVRPVYKRVDTCAAEFEAHTPYLYSTYEQECEADPTDRRKVMILGGGPNRIGQGIEFDYCCVHASMALREQGLETIMVNCNPETVSTDYDVSDRLYFEPLTLEDVLELCDREKPDGVIVQFGGQTPLNLAEGLQRGGVTIWGTPPEVIDRCEDRELFHALLEELGLRQPPGGTSRTVDGALAVAVRVGYPVVVRPSYVLGGRAMEVVHTADELRRYMAIALKRAPDRSILIDRFLSDAVEVDVDALGDGRDIVVCGIMEHIEEAGVHSGDSACSLPPYTLPYDLIVEIRRQTEAMGRALGIVGLMNVQFAVKDGLVFVLEVNPRASRTVPFVSKAIGRPLAKLAALAMAGESLADLGLDPSMALVRPGHYAVKEAVFPFRKFPRVDTLLGPEMRSTGEVMGIAPTFAAAFWKAQEAAGNSLPADGRVFISVRDEDKKAALEIAGRLGTLGLRLVATRGTAAYFSARGIECEPVNKVAEGSPHIVDLLKNGMIDLVINTTSDRQAIADSFEIRRETLTRHVPYFTTVAAARAACAAVGARSAGEPNVRSLQEYAGWGHLSLRGETHQESATVAKRADDK
jgi:carbamoyl-phosphate synthase large subunit